MSEQLSLFDFRLFGLTFRAAALPKPKVETESVLGNDIGQETLQQLWKRLRTLYFPERPDLDRYRVKWSKRKQKRTLASCNFEHKSVSVARELNHRRFLSILEPLLFHEMCHAYLGIQHAEKGHRRSWHGREFKMLEAMHPQSNFLNDWIKTGGWTKAVRSDRARRAYRARQELAL